MNLRRLLLLGAHSWITKSVLPTLRRSNNIPSSMEFFSRHAFIINIELAGVTSKKSQTQDF